MEVVTHVPPLRPAPNPTARLMQEFAERGVLLCLNEYGEVCASGRFFLDEGEIAEDDHNVDEIRENHARIKQELKRIAASGENDPLGLVDLFEEHEYWLECNRIERLMSYGLGQLEAIRKRALEAKTEIVWVKFGDSPNSPPRDGSVLTSDTSPAATANATANPQPRRYPLLTAAALSAASLPQYLVKNALPREGIAAIFGPPGVAKSFLALDLAFAVSDGRAWAGKRVAQCDVLYLCLEGQGGLAQRVQAYRQHHGQDTGAHARFITAPFSLLYHDDVGALCDTVKDAGIRGGVIMIDTLSAASPGADENSSVDMGRILEALKRIREVCGGLVILVHHSGKDATKGLRGHSSLLAALDAVIEVRREDGRRAWRLAKSKDGLDGEEHLFRLSIVELGIDEDGDPITSCVVVTEERAADAVKRVKTPASGNQRIVYEVAGELLRRSRDYGKGGAKVARPCIRLEDLIDACHGRLTVEGRRVTERARDAITGLVNKGCLILRDGWIWVP